MTVLFFLFGGIFLAILSSLVLFPIVPKQTEYKTAKFIIYDRFQGFMEPCCSYEVVEPKLFFFEKHLGYINIEKPIHNSKDVFDLKGNKIIFKYELKHNENDEKKMTVKDTTEILNYE